MTDATSQPAAELAEVVTEAARQIERLRDSNPINRDGRNRAITQALDILAKVAADAPVVAAVMDERALIQAEEDERYQRILAENRARIHEAIAAAESAAQAAHDAGTCGLSEWTCSACESEAQG